MSIPISRTPWLPLALVAAVGASGCAATLATAEPAYVYDAPPPPRRVAVVPVAPYDGAVWVDGHWRWNGHRYYWVDGHYVSPRRGYVYVQPRWERRGRQYVYVPGSWRASSRARVQSQSGGRVRVQSEGWRGRDSDVRRQDADRGRGRTQRGDDGRGGRGQIRAQ